MNDLSNPNISYLDRVKIQAELLVPLLNDLRQELGEKKANEIVYRSLRRHLRTHYLELGKTKTGNGKEKWAALSEELDQLIGDDVAFETLRDDDNAFEFDVTGCRFAQYFLQMGEPELGAILTCEIDDHTTEVAGSSVQLKRPETIMKGGGKCQFRYRFTE